MQLLYEQLNKYVVEEYTGYHQHKVAEQLYPAAQNRTGEHYKAVEQVAGGKAYCESHKKGCNVRADGPCRCVNDLFFKNEVVRNKEQEDIEKRVSPAAYGVSESLDGHQPSERRVKEVDGRDDPVFKHGRKNKD